MSFPLSRLVAVAMAAVLCFAFLVPMSLSHHYSALAVFIVVVFFAYLAANVWLWNRMRQR
jgi:hypothetical protein